MKTLKTRLKVRTSEICAVTSDKIANFLHYALSIKAFVIMIFKFQIQSLDIILGTCIELLL